MQLHANAAVSLIKRRQMVRRVLEERWSVAAAAAAADTSSKTCGKWVAGYRTEGECGLLDRSSAPKRVANRTCERRIAAVVALRRLRFTGPEIAEALAMPLSTVSGILTRIGLGRLGRLGLDPAERYERARPGELIRVDVKKLGRIARPGHRVLGGQPARARAGYHREADNLGWEFVHVAIDDCARLAYVEVLNDDRPASTIGFLRRAVAFYRQHGIRVERLITDNGTRTDQPPTRSPAARWESGTCEPVLTGRKPTARPSGSSAPCSAAGLTARSTATAANAPPPLTAGSPTTTIAANTQPSATSPRAPAYASGTTRSGLTT